MSSDRPIFVVGCPRSGTTMLQLMLHAHPRIALPPENRFVLPAYERRHTFGDLRDPTRRRALARWIAGTPNFDDLGVAPDELEKRLSAAPPTLGSALGTVFQAYAGRFGKPRWGDKRPAYLRHLPTIFRLFPDAQVITIMRDGRDCVASLKEAPWRPPRFGALIDFWARAADASIRASRTYRADQYFQIRYEDLVASPEQELRRICAFLGEDFAPAMTRPSELASVAVPAHKTWHARTHDEVTAARVRSWQRRLTPEEIVQCEAVFGPRLARFGYAPMTAAAPSPGDRVTRVWLSARDRIGPTRVLADRVWGRMRYLGPEPAVAARLTTAQRKDFLAAG